MNVQTTVVLSLLTFFATTWSAAQQVGPDLGREQRLADEIRDVILDGEPVDLVTADGQAFLGIFTASSSSDARGTVVILHGRGFHPDWADVVHPLRVGLTGHGWHTLSIQLPVLGKHAKYFDYLDVFDDGMPRIEAALAHSRQQSPGKVVLLAHSCGSHMAQHWLNQRGDEAVGQIDAFVVIGMGATDYGQPMLEPFALSKLTVPVLDLYAEHDFPAVHRLAGERAAALKAGGNDKSAQLVVPDAEHYFTDRGGVLLEAVTDWLNLL